MNVKQAVATATATLSQSSDSANLDARILTCQACEIDQTTLIAHPELKLSHDQEKRFDKYLDRRTKGEPLAYITGNKEFWSLDFIVNKHVLVPRPDTELLVTFALSAISGINSPRVLDLGTGSGAIAISIAKERSDCFVVATDASSHALEVAKKNASKLGTKIIFIESNWYEKIPKEKFDVLVSNPPYIACNDPNLEKYVFKHEPENALISGDNGVADIRKIIAGASEYLSNKGHLLLEHGFQQHEVVQKLFKKSNFQQITTHKDLSGNNRATSGIINF